MCTPSIPVRSPFLSHLLRLRFFTLSKPRSPRFRTYRSYLACHSFIWFYHLPQQCLGTTSILLRRILSRAQRSSERVCESRFWTLDTSSRQHHRVMENVFCGVRSIIFSPVHARKPLGCSMLISQFGGSGKQAVRATPRAPCRRRTKREAKSAMPACLLSLPSFMFLVTFLGERPYLRRRSRNRDCHIDHFPAVATSS